MSKKIEVQKMSERDLIYKRAFNTDAGLRVLEDLKKTLRFGETVYHTNQSQTDFAFHSGRQSVINDILFLLNKEIK